MKRNIFIVLFSVVFFSNLNAQDAQISMFTTSPLNINPATTGFFQGECMRAHINYRNQWASVLNKGISTYGFSFDKPEKKLNLGWGLAFSNTTAGKGALKDMNIMASFSYNLKLSRKGGNNLAFGLQAGIKQKSFNQSELFFGNQYENATVGFNPNKSNGELFTSQSKIYPDFNFGAMYYVKDQWKKFQPWLGISVFHLLSPKESFTSVSTGNEARLPRKFIGYVGAKIKTSKTTTLQPIILLQSQGNVMQEQFGAILEFLSPKDQNSIGFQLGAFYRTQDAVVAMIGLGFSSFLLTFDYEINTSSLHKASNYMGGPEISLKYLKKCKGHNVKFN